MPPYGNHPTPAVATTLPLPRINPRAALRFTAGFTLFLILFACAAIVGLFIGHILMTALTNVPVTLDQAQAWGAM